MGLSAVEVSMKGCLLVLFGLCKLSENGEIRESQFEIGENDKKLNWMILGKAYKNISDYHKGKWK